MPNFPICKVALPGEGKTKWLLSKADQAFQNNTTNIYYLSDVYTNYIRFMDKFLTVYGYVCSADYISNIDNVPNGSVVLIDDITKNSVNVGSLIDKGCTVYMTISGVSE